MEQAKKHVGKVASSKEGCSQGEEATQNEKMNDLVDRTRKNQSDRIAKISDDKMAAEADSKRRWMQEVCMGHLLGRLDRLGSYLLFMTTINLTRMYRRIAG